MSIQIEGINTELLLYKNKLEKRTPFSERMISRFHRVVEKANDLPESDSFMSKVKEGVLAAQAFGYGTVALASDAREMSAKKKALMEATGLDKDSIAIDINELELLRSKRKSVKVFGDSIRYSAQIKKEWLASIETIFGDADLQALDNFECLAALKAIYGNLNLSQVKDSKVDLSGLHVQMVYGDIHAEQAASTAGLEDLLAVGGTIYYQDKAYTLDEFQEVFGNTKERQI